MAASRSAIPRVHTLSRLKFVFLSFLRHAMMVGVARSRVCVRSPWQRHDVVLSNSSSPTTAAAATAAEIHLKRSNDWRRNAICRRSIGVLWHVQLLLVRVVAARTVRKEPGLDRLVQQ